MDEKEYSYFYKWKSMKGTFRTGDMLFVENIYIDKLEKGDVIVFKGQYSFGSFKNLVHRIISISKKGLITRGDNNFYFDAKKVSWDNLVGRVTHLERNGKQLPVKNGKPGIRRANMLNLKLHIKKTIWRFCKLPYTSLKKKDIISLIWKPDIKKIHINTTDSELIKYIHKNRTVGQVWIRQEHTKIKKPYDLVIRCKQPITKTIRQVKQLKQNG